MLFLAVGTTSGNSPHIGTDAQMFSVTADGTTWPICMDSRPHFRVVGFYSSQLNCAPVIRLETLNCLHKLMVYFVCFKKKAFS